MYDDHSESFSKCDYLRRTATAGAIACGFLILHSVQAQHTRGQGVEKSQWFRPTLHNRLECSGVSVIFATPVHVTKFARGRSFEILRSSGNNLRVGDLNIPTSKKS